MPKNKNNFDEVYGIALIAGALIFMIFLFTNITGVLGEWLIIISRYIVGFGVYVIPLVLILWGLAFLFHRPEKNLEIAGIGYLIAFISFVSIVHLLYLGKNADNSFSNYGILNNGGYIGAVIAFGFRTLIGQLSSYILFTATFLIGLIFATNISVSEYLIKAKDTIKERFTVFRQNRSRISKDSRGERKKKLKEVKDEDITATIEKGKMDVGAEENEIGIPEFAVEETHEIESDQIKIKVPDEIKKSKKYVLPALNLLRKTGSKNKLKRGTKESIEILESTLHEFDVRAKVTKVVSGPTVTRYELQLESGIKVNRVLSLADDISLALASPDIRIIAPIPGKSAIGIEVPNIQRELVMLGDILSSKEHKSKRGVLNVGLGKDIGGNPVIPDLGQMPHMLIAGATGSGKSICINSILVSLLMQATPDEVRLILIDPKRIELNLYNELPHLLVPVVTNTKQAASALNWAVEEMEARFEALSEMKVRNIDAYNNQINNVESQSDDERKKMSYIIIVIDELADLMMVAANEVEQAICRVAQMARAVGIHLVVATQRPSADVITGLIKSNITSRVAFAVSSQMDSRVILDTGGAEKLVGKGDLLFIDAGSIKPIRIQGSFITEHEIELVVSFIKDQMKPEYQEDIIKPKDSQFGLLDYEEPLIDDAIKLVVTTNQASISMIQRRLRVGYTRAARMIDIMEERGIVGPYEGSKPREVLLKIEDLQDIDEQQNNDNFDRI